MECHCCHRYYFAGRYVGFVWQFNTDANPKPRPACDAEVDSPGHTPILPQQFQPMHHCSPHCIRMIIRHTTTVAFVSDEIVMLPEILHSSGPYTGRLLICHG